MKESVRRESRPAPTAATALRANRKVEGVCPRCGSVLETSPETNALTGRPLRRDGELVEISVCSNRCGYSFRPYARRR